MTDGGTAAALLDAAEAAFAEHGIDNVSLRSIMRSARANVAAVHYHYGSRAALERAVLDRVLEPLQRRRLELLDELLAGGEQPAVDDLVQALVRPDFEALLHVGARNPAGARVVGALYCRPPVSVKRHVEHSFRPVAQRFLPHLVAELPHLGPQELSWRVRWSVFAVVGAVLNDDDTIVTADTIDDEVAKVVAVACGALAAPATEKELS
ncbi:MAG: TetR family transcriptional regulator [Acidimicrobiia bacterium]|nr:TetR family transcriptional regulator [Acidimicrobiia bacterium]